MLLNADIIFFFYQLIWLLHAQSRLVCQAEIMPAGRSKDFISRILITKRGYLYFWSFAIITLQVAGINPITPKVCGINDNNQTGRVAAQVYGFFFFGGGGGGGNRSTFVM